MLSLAWTAVIAVMSTDLAQTNSTRPSIEGVWEGTVGDLPIRACFNQPDYGDGFGVYYYSSRLQLIQLRQLENESDTYVEGFPWQKDIPQWNFSKVSARELAGRWTNGGKMLPFRLARIPGPKLNDDETPCSGKLFYEPRLKGIRIVSRPAVPQDARYRRLVLEYPDRKEVGVETIELVGSTLAVRKINAKLRKPLEGNPPEWHDCELYAGGGNSGGGWSERWETKLFSRRWLGVTRYVEAYCGGAHPDSWYTPLTFDLQTGNEVDLSGWFTKQVAGLPFSRLLFANWSRGEDPECRETVEQSVKAFALDIELRRTGFAFTPNDLPHVVAACGDEFFLTFKQLTPYLTPEGRKYVAALRAEAASTR